ncbi:helix-turn-helix domain-containing protein [Microbacterium chocolatum]|uniref:winged helix-turn-helix transcriptional regulator n=1 Tax=Microbacterium aurantiacum TaxID=162393 RepID=UPI00338FE5EA
MAKGEHGGPACDAAISLAFSVLGKRWNGMILDALSTGPVSFATLKRTVEGISDAMLSDRLTELAETSLVTRDVDPGPPVAVRYALTLQGERLMPVLEQLGVWARDNLAVEPGAHDPR